MALLLPKGKYLSQPKKVGYSVLDHKTLVAIFDRRTLRAPLLNLERAEGILRCWSVWMSQHSLFNSHENVERKDQYADRRWIRVHQRWKERLLFYIPAIFKISCDELREGETAEYETWRVPRGQSIKSVKLGVGGPFSDCITIVTCRSSTLSLQHWLLWLVNSCWPSPIHIT